MSAPEMSVVIGFRDWGVERLRRSVSSLHRALGATGGEIIISDYGSADPSASRAVAEDSGARWVHTPGDPVWSRSRALNAGFAVADGDLLISTDADMLFSPGTLEVVHAQHAAAGRCALFLQCRDLPESVPEETFDEPDRIDWAALERSSRLRPRWGMGGMMAIDRDGFTRLHGFDERLHTYGREDIDFARRARRAGWRTHWVDEPRARMFHMWHAPTISAASATDAGREAIRRNRRLVDSDLTVARNLRATSAPLPSARPLVSIVILGADDAPAERTIATALAQTVRDLEVLVARRGSSPLSAPIADSRVRDVPVAESDDILQTALAASHGVHVAVVRAGEILPLERTERLLLALAEGAAGVHGREVRLLSEGLPEVYAPRDLRLSHLLMRRDEMRALPASDPADLRHALARTGLTMRETTAPVVLTGAGAAPGLEDAEELPDPEAQGLRALALTPGEAPGREVLVDPAPPAELLGALEGHPVSPIVLIDGSPLEGPLRVLHPTDADLVVLARTGARLSLQEASDEDAGPSAPAVLQVLEHARGERGDGPLQIRILEREEMTADTIGPLYTVEQSEQSLVLSVTPLPSNPQPDLGAGRPWLLVGVEAEEVWG
ncbi:glycosyltransferase family 2 protein [Brachybacterium sp. J153]|uniref:glycosyltransferase family 2 protein n=1 Tax=Brachybacterium sp. J153 TaxID=3116488 RepID=UPI002E783E4A|nr:glycosyltransferase [Brachybacterium sp. J153]MEE1617842.1 glycosyltransferase [Brachybacterium sp. J153]